MRSGSSATGNNSFNSLVGTGSNKHVDGLDAVIRLFSSSCPIVVKHCSFSLGAMIEAEALDKESTYVIVFLILSILSVKKFINALLLNCRGIFRYGDICLFVNLATVLNKKQNRLFWLLFISSQSAVSKHVNRKLSGIKNCGRKRCTTNRENHSFMRIVKQNRFKNLGELHKEWTKAGVKASVCIEFI